MPSLPSGFVYNYSTTTQGMGTTTVSTTETTELEFSFSRPIHSSSRVNLTPWSHCPRISRRVILHTADLAIYEGL
jgi:hypothetical protein